VKPNNTLLGLIAALLATGSSATAADDAPRNVSRVIEPGGLPRRVQVFEDYETEIEKRWWLRGTALAGDLAPSLSASVPNRRVSRAGETKDFDDLMGDPKRVWKAVVFNPVPGPPMGANTRLSFRYRLRGTDTMRVQIYSLSNGYHRHLTLTGLPQGAWQSAAVAMTQARRPDGSGGPLETDERIDDLQFYVAPDAELAIDDIVLFEAAPPGERQPIPRRIIFTGWFDTGKQGAGHEWPGDFAIVAHEPPRTWKCAKSVPHPQTGEPWIRVHLRGPRALSALNRLRFACRLSAGGPLRVVLADRDGRARSSTMLRDLPADRWTEASVDLPAEPGALAENIQFYPANGAELLIDDVLLFEPGEEVVHPAAPSQR